MLNQHVSVCRIETLDGNPVLQLDPVVPGVFGGPYPLGIDPVSHTNTIGTLFYTTTIYRVLDRILI